MKKLLVLFLLLVSGVSYGQAPECNQKCRGSQKKIPKDICIPHGQYIRRIFNDMDINLDGFNDFVISHSKEETVDGDTMFISIYYAVPNDSSFILKKTYTNLYPIIFSSYNSYIIEGDSALNEFQGLYGGNYPLKRMGFQDGEIFLRVGQDFENQTLHFMYNKEKDNWYLTRSEYLLEMDDYRRVSETEYKGDEQISIDEFSFFDWL